MDRDRRCARTSCGAPATAALSYQYTERRAWLDELPDDPSPATHALCAAHADALVVPRGWTKDDRRTPARLPFPRTIAV